MRDEANGIVRIAMFVINIMQPSKQFPTGMLRVTYYEAKMFFFQEIC